MRKYLFSMLTLLGTVLTTVSCSSASDAESEDLESKMLVNMTTPIQPVRLTDEQRTFANDNNRFTLNFLVSADKASRPGSSYVYSPLSVTYVLAMVNAAATGQTERELEQTLGFHEGGIQAVNDYCKKLIDGLPKVDAKVTLDIANALFVNKNKATLQPAYQQDMLNYYDAQAEALDFRSDDAKDRINGWCNEKTKGMIPTILSRVDPDVLTYLLNAIYFKADWASKFDPKNTRTEAFGSGMVPMMHQNVLIRYMKNDTYSAIEMPYGSGLWSMVVMMPEEGKTADDIIDDLKMFGVYPMLYDDIDGSLDTWVFGPYEVDLKLPRYETSSDTDDLEDGLIGLMKKMGIKRAFDDALAEIPNMCELPVYIDIMRQKAKIKVNEEGSEAAAVTVAGVTNKSMGSEPKEYPKATFHANRPFVYVIHEQSSGVILFVGKFTGA